MPTLELKPTHKAVVAYYDALTKFGELGVKHEGAVSSAFEDLLVYCARLTDRVVIPKPSLRLKGGKSIIPDASIVDSLSQVLRYGLWEAKDTGDDLDKEIKAKFKAGYPRDNMLFQEPRRAVLYQNGERFFDADLTKADQLVHVLDLFFTWRPPAFDVWEKAVEEFKVRVPELGESLAKLIVKERETNPKYPAAFDGFLRLCRASLNPNLAESAVAEMVIQHLLTERIFRKVFDIGDFMQRNVIAQEIEKVIDALTSRNFSRDKFSKSLEHFYVAIEQAAETITDFSEKQKFLNTVYERFFQGFCVKVADTHGIVYTPQPLVDFMVASVEHVLKTEFKTSLADKNVHILDPFTGTGNFIVNIMRRIPKSALPHKYRDELHCNEVMLMPYYVASMNLEHAYYEATGKYEPFPGICLVDTFETAEKEQAELFSFNEPNTERVKRQRRAPIKVIIANPPYNAWQQDENDNNKNRKYPEVDRRLRLTYTADSKATLRSSLSDPYIKAIRWASDRIGDQGVIAYVTNNGFIDGIACDGLRKHLAQDFDLIYILDLGGNVRKNPKLSGTTHNVFGIQIGVSINLLIRLPVEMRGKRKAKISYHSVPGDWRRGQKYDFLTQSGSVIDVKWKGLAADANFAWLTSGLDRKFPTFLAIGSKGDENNGEHVFNSFSTGLMSQRDSVVYNFDPKVVIQHVKTFATSYNMEITRWHDEGCPKDVDGFVSPAALKWSRNLKRHFARSRKITVETESVRPALFRPFCKKHIYFAPVINDERGSLPKYFPTAKLETENRLIWIKTGAEVPFFALMADCIPDRLPQAGSQCFPLYTYSEDGKHRLDNIPLSALVHFQNHYDDDAITRADIFHYVYALLHHPDYRARYAENLKRELPRLPLVGKAAEFHAFAKAGKKLAELHVNYEQQKEYPLEKVENREVKLDWRVEAMKLSKDHATLYYNDFLTLTGIPREAFDYRLGNRSALEWVIDQYRVTKDEHGHITSDPNRADDEQYIARLIGQVVTVSVETMKIVKGLPKIN